MVQLYKEFFFIDELRENRLFKKSGGMNRKLAIKFFTNYLDDLIYFRYSSILIRLLNGCISSAVEYFSYNILEKLLFLFFSSNLLLRLSILLVERFKLFGLNKNFQKLIERRFELIGFFSKINNLNKQKNCKIEYKSILPCKFFLTPFYSSEEIFHSNLKNNFSKYFDMKLFEGSFVSKSQYAFENTNFERALSNKINEICGIVSSLNFTKK